jgi:SAM-dependent methyltransferase
VKDVLIVGSGTGQNTVPAVKHHATNIDAVEIDPRILQLGKEYDPYYKNPAVHLVCDDARHFFNTCNKKYDLIVFSLLDSQTVAGQGSSVRLDSYVYTVDSFKRALSLLKPDGVLFVSFAQAKNWISVRLCETLKAAYGKDVLVLGRKSGSLQAGQALICNAPPDYQDHIDKDRWQSVPPASGQYSHSVLTDDWPYLYVEPDVIDWPYFLVVAEVICIAVFCARHSVLSKNTMPIYWQMFFLGSGFLLLELESIARLSLLFGSTWLTSAIVINGVLVLILSANGLVIKFQARIAKQQKLIYAGLFIALLVSFLLPQNSIMALSSSIGSAAYGLIALITLLPMFFAGLIFPSAFGRVDSPPKALTFNLLGSVVGGLLEYSSYYLGNNGLIAVSALLYGCSFLFFLLSQNNEAKLAAANVDRVNT